MVVPVVVVQKAGGTGQAQKVVLPNVLNRSDLIVGITIVTMITYTRASAMTFAFRLEDVLPLLTLEQMEQWSVASVLAYSVLVATCARCLAHWIACFVLKLWSFWLFACSHVTYIVLHQLLLAVSLSLTLETGLLIAGKVILASAAFLTIVWFLVQTVSHPHIKRLLMCD